MRVIRDPTFYSLKGSYFCYTSSVWKKSCSVWSSSTVYSVARFVFGDTTIVFGDTAIVVDSLKSNSFDIVGLFKVDTFFSVVS